MKIQNINYNTSTPNFKARYIDNDSIRNVINEAYEMEKNDPTQHSGLCKRLYSSFVKIDEYFPNVKLNHQKNIVCKYKSKDVFNIGTDINSTIEFNRNLMNANSKEFKTIFEGEVNKRINTSKNKLEYITKEKYPPEWYRAEMIRTLVVPKKSWWPF